MTIDVSSPESGVIVKVMFNSFELFLLFTPPNHPKNGRNYLYFLSFMLKVGFCDLFNDLQLLANEGDTVEPGNKIAIISRSADATTHVAPSETTSEKAAPQPTQKISEEKKAPKVETAPATEKPKAPPAPAPAPQRSPTEPQLPPKEKERRVSHCGFMIHIPP